MNLKVLTELSFGLILSHYGLQGVPGATAHYKLLSGYSLLLDIQFSEVKNLLSDVSFLFSLLERMCICPRWGLCFPNSTCGNNFLHYVKCNISLFFHGRSIYHSMIGGWVSSRNTCMSI
ncbi:hypothetical protein AMTRI_Chr09g18810 [Amborella trichopoda]